MLNFSFSDRLFKAKTVACFALMVILPTFAFADPVDSARVQAVVQGLLDSGDGPVRTSAGDTIRQIVAKRDAKGDVQFFLVKIAPDGFVIVSADDYVEPIIAMSGSGRYEPDPQNPLYAMVQRDTRERRDWARQLKLKQSRRRYNLASSHALPKAALKARNRWQALPYATTKKTPQLSAMANDTYAVAGLGSLADVRVSPLVQTKWSQGTAKGQNCYNYYTPNNYVSGCVATAMAQIVRYHRYPTAGVGQVSQTCSVDGASQTCTTRGGDGNGGAYDYDLMTLAPNSSSYNSASWQMIGSLMNDAGVAAKMMYGSGGSGAYVSNTSSGMRNIFGYSTAVYGYYLDNKIPGGTVAAINSNLNGGFPVMLAITAVHNGSTIGHMVVADGWGMAAGSMYHHVNLGWGGSYDAWYNLPNIDAGYNWSVVAAVTFNMFPTHAGEILSGRVVDGDGVGVAGATVTATPEDASPSFNATTNAKGYYGIPVAANKTYDLTSTATDYGTGTLDNIAITSTSDGCYGGWGSYYGADITMAAHNGVTLEATGLQTSNYLRWTSPSGAGMPSETVYIRRATGSYPATSSDGVLVYSGTDATYHDTGLASGETYYYTIWLNDGSAYAANPAGGTTNATATTDPGTAVLVWRSSTGQLVQWRLAENGSLHSYAYVYASAVGAAWNVFSTADFDGDGIDDVVWRNTSTGEVIIWYITLDGRLKSFHRVETILDSNWKLGGVAKLDGDNVPDFVWHHQTTNAVHHWLMNANGTIKSSAAVHSTGVSALSWKIAGFGDLDQDGVSDILWHNINTGGIVWWKLDNAGKFVSVKWIINSLATGWEIKAFGNINGDANPDIILHHKTNGYVAFWTLNSAVEIDTYGLVHSSAANAATWKPVGLVDVDGDGVDDLVWRNLSSGSVDYWKLGSDGKFVSAANVYAAVGLSWTINDTINVNSN